MTLELVKDGIELPWDKYISTSFTFDNGKNRVMMIRVDKTFDIFVSALSNFSRQQLSKKVLFSIIQEENFTQTDIESKIDKLSQIQFNSLIFLLVNQTLYEGNFFPVCFVFHQNFIEDSFQCIGLKTWKLKKLTFGKMKKSGREERN